MPLINGIGILAHFKKIMSNLNLQPPILQPVSIPNFNLNYSHLQDFNLSGQLSQVDDLGAPKRSSLLDEKAEKYIRDSANIVELPGDEDDDDLDDEDDTIDLEEELEIETDELNDDELEIVDSDSDDILIDGDVDDDDDDDEDIL